ncbi:two-component system sensor histidine kinase NtrB [Paraliomyxa miuraensis]|uniref:two-component system sensor histidine kinase NtrB n=1 Tax=Paraliomyxa miuraensis TaxID=376150 RepID=UPI0022574B0A|nr:ATP-binding protein [Paraliomyxa miuraensis]MCX4245403.1 ATP-binding protein [Paraliomyxa miuraensis]
MDTDSPPPSPSRPDPSRPDPSRSDPSRSLVDAAHPEPKSAGPESVLLGGAATATLDPRRRRISYFMLVRLVMLALFTAVATFLAWQRDEDFDVVTHRFVWGTLVVGYVLTIVFARWLPRVRDLDRFAWLQTTTDILLAAVVVQMSGGADSGFVSLYLIAVLGASTMGGTRQTWAAAGACALIYGTTSLLQGTGTIEPQSLGHSAPLLDPIDVATSSARTLAALLGVTVLSSFLNKQLASSTLQVGDLRAMNENILRSLTSGLIGVDDEARVIYWNPAAEAILGLRDDDRLRPMTALMPEAAPLLQTNEVLARTELEVRTRAGSSLHLGLGFGPLHDGRGQLIGQLISFQDLTRIRELAEQVRRNERLAAVGSLAASVAHEIRNPLAAISGSADLLATASLGDEDTRLLSIIRRESKRLSALVTDMLAFTRPRPPNRGRVALRRVAQETAEHFKADPANAGMQLELRGDDAIPDVEVDAAQLTQVLWNLLRNAAEAMDGRGPMLLEVRSRPEDREVEVAVIDHGPGIPEDRRDRIFDPFFTTKERGTGFGLAIVYRIVQDNGGAIELSSIPGHGTSFRLRFPAIEGADEPRALPPHS